MLDTRMNRERFYISVVSFLIPTSTLNFHRTPSAPAIVKNFAPDTIPIRFDGT